MFANIQNYQITIILIFSNVQFDKLQVHFGIFTSLHMRNLHIFILASTTKL
jgi:hypothetical protein